MRSRREGEPRCGNCRHPWLKHIARPPYDCAVRVPRFRGGRGKTASKGMGECPCPGYLPEVK